VVLGFPSTIVSRWHITSVLLILALDSSVFACVGSCQVQPTRLCLGRTAQEHGQRDASRAPTNEANCRARWQTSPANCSLRGLLHFHFATFPKLQASAPLENASGHVSLPRPPAPRISSIGSPGTDRGPPLS